jgi:hypothetical protein
MLAVLFIVSGLANAHMMSGNMGGGTMAKEQPSDSQGSTKKSASSQKGYAQVHTFCTGCHQPPNPQQHTPKQWPLVLERMQAHMQRQRMRLPDSSEVKLILEYLDDSKTDD